MQDYDRERQADIDLLFECSRNNFIDSLQGLKDIWISYARPNGTPEEQLKARQLFYRIILIQEIYFEIFEYYVMLGSREKIQELLRERGVQGEDPEKSNYFNSTKEAQRMINNWLEKNSK